MEIFYGPVFCIFVGSQIRPILPCTFHSGPHTTTTTNHKTISLDTMRLTVRIKYIWFPFGTPCILYFLSYLRPDKNTKNGTIKYFHFEMEKKMEKRGGGWKFGTMTTWSALEVVWSATSRLGMMNGVAGLNACGDVLPASCCTCAACGRGGGSAAAQTASSQRSRERGLREMWHGSQRRSHLAISASRSSRTLSSLAALAWLCASPPTPPLAP